MTMRTRDAPGSLVTGGALRDGALIGASANDLVVPVWVRRLRGDGLPVTKTFGAVPLLLGSQRFVERWGRVTNGY